VFANLKLILSSRGHDHRCTVAARFLHKAMGDVVERHVERPSSNQIRCVFTWAAFKTSNTVFLSLREAYQRLLHSGHSLAKLKDAALGGRLLEDLHSSAGVAGRSLAWKVRPTTPGSEGMSAIVTPRSDLSHLARATSTSRNTAASASQIHGIRARM
jgi:hypothetical protein